MHDIQAIPSPDASERELRAYRRNIAKISERPRHNYATSHLEKAYQEYTLMYREQEDLRNNGCGLREFSDAMSRLSNFHITIRHSKFIKAIVSQSTVARNRQGFSMRIHVLAYRSSARSRIYVRRKDPIGIGGRLITSLLSYAISDVL